MAIFVGVVGIASAYNRFRNMSTAFAIGSFIVALLLILGAISSGRYGREFDDELCGVHKT